MAAFFRRRSRASCLKPRSSPSLPASYAVTCRDLGFSFIPAEKRPGRPRLWELVEFGEPVASIRRNPYLADVTVPVPLPAVLMGFSLAAFGVMGEKDLLPSRFSWGAAPQ